MFPQVIPLVHALMETRSQEAYDHLFALVRRVAPGLEPLFIMTDFEVAQQGALAAAWPRARLTGCLWHYAKAISRTVRGLGLHTLVRDNASARRIVLLTMAIPLAPAARINEAFAAVMVEARRLGVMTHMQGFFRYVRDTWIVGVGREHLCFFGARFRANNAAECHHRNLNSRLMRRPNIWRFMGKLVLPVICSF